MRLGGAVFKPYANADEWAQLICDKGYSAAMCPIDYTADDETIEAYKSAAKNHNIVIGEVGIWNNTLDPDPQKAAGAILYAKRQLALAEKMEARCCVNIAGTRTPDLWYGPHPQNFTDETFHKAVSIIREIIDAVNPEKTFYTLEPSPWLFPDTIDCYLDFIKAVNRPGFAVHWDPVNMMYTPKAYYRNGEFLKECIARLGPYIRSCHIKDLYMGEKFTLFVEERRSGEGILDYKTLISALDQLDPDMPVFLEHMETEEEFDIAAKYVRGVMASQNSYHTGRSME